MTMLATALERLGRPRVPQRKSLEDVAAQLFELNRRWREGQAALDKAQTEVDRLDEELGSINDEAYRLANDSGLSEEEWQAIWDAGLHPDVWETGSVPGMPDAKRKTEGTMSLATILERLGGKRAAGAPETKADGGPFATLAEVAARAVDLHRQYEAIVATRDEMEELWRNSSTRADHEAAAEKLQSLEQLARDVLEAAEREEEARSGAYDAALAVWEAAENQSSDAEDKLSDITVYLDPDYIADAVDEIREELQDPDNFT